MQRIAGAGYRTAISEGLGMLPESLRARLEGVDFLCGVDPCYAGLHRFQSTLDGRSYGDTAHVAYGYMVESPASSQATTVVMPVLDEPWVVVHELGHVLHEALGFCVAPDPVTQYAESNRFEAFAEAFTAMHVPGYAPWGVSQKRLARYGAECPAEAGIMEGRSGL